MLDPSLDAGSKPRPQAPGPEQLWKYCKRCNSWKERPANFSKNHRTPDGLQFYCRCCHNRMTKFNQERRLEDRHIAEKHHVLTSPSRGTLARSATGRASLGSSKSHSTSSRSKGSRGFDVISSKIPRQQRTHATYRRDSDPSLSSHLATQQQPLKSPSPQRHSMSPCQGLNTQRSLGSDNQSSHSSAKQQVQQLSRRKPLRSPPSKSQAKESAELMLQANAVLHKLDQSLLWAAEAASAELAASGTRPSSGHNSRALPPSPLPPSPHARSPSSSVPPRVVSSASPRDHTRSKEQDWGGQDSGSNPPVGPSPVCLQQRSFSTPTQQCNGTPPSSLCSLAHSLAQMRHAAAVKPTDSTDRVNWDQQRQTQQQQGQHGSIKSPTDLRHPTAEDPPTHASSGAEDALPDAVSELTREASQSQCPAEPSDEAGHSKGAASGASGVSQDNPVPGLSGGQQPPALRDTTPVDESGSQAAGGEDINKPGTSCREDPIGTALPPVLQVSDHTAKTGPARQPAASDTAASGKAVSEAAVKLPVRPMSAPPGTLDFSFACWALSCLALAWPSMQSFSVEWHNTAGFLNYSVSRGRTYSCSCTSFLLLCLQ